MTGSAPINTLNGGAAWGGEGGDKSVIHCWASASAEGK